MSFWVNTCSQHLRWYEREHHKHWKPHDVAERSGLPGIGLLLLIRSVVGEFVVFDWVNIDDDADFLLQNAHGLVNIDIFDQKCRSTYSDWFSSINDGRQDGMDVLRSFVRRLVKWSVCTTIKQDSHRTSERINVGLGFLHE